MNMMLKTIIAIAFITCLFFSFNVWGNPVLHTGKKQLAIYSEREHLKIACDELYSEVEIEMTYKLNN